MGGAQSWIHTGPIPFLLGDPEQVTEPLWDSVFLYGENEVRPEGWLAESIGGETERALKILELSKCKEKAGRLFSLRG